MNSDHAGHYGRLGGEGWISVTCLALLPRNGQHKYADGVSSGVM